MTVRPLSSLALAMFALLGLTALPATVRGQGGYEFEVYGTDIAPPRGVELELQTNFVPRGPAAPGDEGRPNAHALRSSAELSYGLARWLEGAVYAVGYTRGGATAFVGNRLRLTAIVPQSWNLPVRLGLAQEVTRTRVGFAETPWTYELTPILERSFGAFDAVLDPALERGFGGSPEHHKIELEPRARLTWHVGGDDDDGALSLEYYAGLGPIGMPDPRADQQHHILASFETELSPRWELSVGAGHGLTRASDRALVTTRIEYRFGQ